VLKGDNLLNINFETLVVRLIFSVTFKKLVLMTSTVWDECFFLCNKLDLIFFR